VLVEAIKMAELSKETPPPTESISESPEVTEIHSDWRTPFMVYLRIGGLPEDKDKHERMCHRARHYTLVNDELFQQSVNDTLMRCVMPDEGCCAHLGP
jgi:hypothetical protein